MIQVVWFKRDLRTSDHRPLAEAAAAGPVLPLYVAEPDYWRLPDTSIRQWLAIRAALQELAARLTLLGAPLIVRMGAVTEVLAKIHAAVGIARVLAHEETGNLWTYRRDRAVRGYCRSQRIPFVEFSQSGVIRGAGARDRWAAHHGRFIAEPIVPEPVRLAPVSAAKVTEIPTADMLGLRDDGGDAAPLVARESGLALLESFLAGRGADYRRGMSSPLGGATCCSRLSVPLATGAMSVREVLQRVYGARRELSALPSPERPLPLTALQSLIARLHWRGHFMQKLESEPELEEHSFHPLHESARMPTRRDDAALEAWATGQTGIPFIDACMRSLIATGWLNFRMRAMLQSFASYQLGLDWRASGERLARLFTDYEPGIHWPQVQMQSGQTGINTPRIYNPVKQARDQDPDGVFTRRWVPELEGGGYRSPIVDPADAARAARARLTAVRQTAGYREAAHEVYLRHGSRGRRLEQRGERRGRGRGAEATTERSGQMGLFDANPNGTA